MQKNIPTTMQAVLLPAPKAELITGEVPVPQPGPGQVLIRMAASPINPSDLSFLRGNYGVKKEFPVVPGFEGSGVVVAAGSGLLPRLWLGKRVACASDNRLNGTWAEYMVTSAQRCVPLMGSVSDEQGSMLLANPLTALAFFDRIKKEAIKGVVVNAAASALGRMIIRMGQKQGIAVVAVVRKEQQIGELSKMGATVCLNSEAPDFAEQLKTHTHQHQATLFLDAVAGPVSQTILQAMPKGSWAWVYGSLSLSDTPMSSGTLIFEQKVIRGFWLSQVLAEKSFWKAFMDTRRVQRLLEGTLDTHIQGRYGFDDPNTAVVRYKENMSGGKVLFIPD